MNSHHDNATVWRDLRDALPAEQIAYLEDWENHSETPPPLDGIAPSPEKHARALLFSARYRPVPDDGAAVRGACTPELPA